METHAGADFVDKARADWSLARPELDVESIEVMGRISRIAALSQIRTEQFLARADLSRAEFDVLCTLARGNRPLRASEVTAATMLSGASTTKTADRLVKRGLVERLSLERDGRVVLMQLTPSGTALIDSEFPDFLERDREMLSGLTASEKTRVAALLRKIALRLETPA